MKLIFEVLFYSWLIYILGTVTGLDTTSVSLPQALFPTIFGEYWFVTAYVGMYLVSPILAVLSKALAKEQHKIVIIVGFVIFSIIPVLTTASFVVNGFIWLCYLWVIASYIRKYPDSRISKMGIRHLVITVLLFEASVITLFILGKTMGINALVEHCTYFKSMYSCFDLAAAIAMLNIFKLMRLKASRTVNFIAAGTFGVYLLHDNPIARCALWSFVFNVLHVDSLQMPVFIIVYFLIVAVIFVVGVLFDGLRRTAFEKPLFTLINRRFGQTFLMVDNRYNFARTKASRASK